MIVKMNIVFGLWLFAVPFFFFCFRLFFAEYEMLIHNTTQHKTENDRQWNGILITFKWNDRGMEFIHSNYRTFRGSFSLFFIQMYNSNHMVRFEIWNFENYCNIWKYWLKGCTERNQKCTFWCFFFLFLFSFIHGTSCFPFINDFWWSVRN